MGLTNFFIPQRVFYAKKMYFLMASVWKYGTFCKPQTTQNRNQPLFTFKKVESGNSYEGKKYVFDTQLKPIFLTVLENVCGTDSSTGKESKTDYRENLVFSFSVMTLKYESLVCCCTLTIEVNQCLLSSWRCLSLLAKLYLQKQVCNLWTFVNTLIGIVIFLR